MTTADSAARCPLGTDAIRDSPIPAGFLATSASAVLFMRRLHTTNGRFDVLVASLAFWISPAPAPPSLFEAQ